MEPFFSLIALLLAVPAIATIAALVRTINLGQEVRYLESRLAALERARTPAASAEERSAPPTTPARDEAPAPPEPELPSEAAEPVQPATPAGPAVAVIPPAGMSLEERLGTRWTVWVGGLALALGGIFLVRYSIEQGLLGPRVRVALGALLALVLIIAGEWARRTERLAGIAGLPSANIPSILTAAGTTVAYADIYAAHALYEFLAPGVAFLLLGIVALATLAAALLHGPALAGLGLIGAYVTPLLVASDSPNYWALYIYLAVVTASAFALARMRMWRWLAVSALALSVAWTAPGIGAAAVSALTAHVFHIVSGFALAAIFIVAGLLLGPPTEPGRIDGVSSAALGAYLLAAACLVLANRHDPIALGAFVVLIAATVAIAWGSEAATAAVPAAALLAVLVIIRWAVDFDVAHLIALSGPAAEAEPEKANYGWHVALGIGFALLFGTAGYLAQGRLGIVFGLGVAVNPLFTGEPVGGKFINLILLGYGLPAILAAALALLSRESRPRQYGAVAAVLAVALALSYLSLQVRTFFHGEVLNLGAITDAEQYTYSVVWLGFGVLLLIVGVRLRSHTVRLTSAAVVMLTVLKVFLVDVGGLTGIYQALSFIGLGIVLLAIGWFYQRLLFPRTASTG